MKSTNTNRSKARSFEQAKLSFQVDHIIGNDTGESLMELATAVAYSVLAKVIDPQRKVANNRNAVSNSGVNPALVALRRGIAHDRATLANTAHNADKATKATYTADGDPVTEVVDKEAEAALADLLEEALSDGLDLVQEAAAAILEEAVKVNGREFARHVDRILWLDTPYTVRRLSKRVYIRREESAAYREEETTPMQEVYRVVRRAIADSRAMQTDPRNGYSYIEEMTDDGLDTIYFRLKKYADLGGYDCDGNYTVDRQSVEDVETIISSLNLTTRQAQILSLRMQGYGIKATASYLGVSHQAIAKTIKQVQEKATAAGLARVG